MSSVNRCLSAAVTAVLMLAAGASAAQEKAADSQAAEPRVLLRPPPEAAIASPITDRFQLRGTYFGPSVDTIFRFDADDGTPGTVLSAEDDLGLDDKADQGRIELMFRFGERSRLRIDYFKLNRFGAVTLDEDIQFGNDVFLAGEPVETSLDFRFLAFSWTYSLLKRERYEAGLGLGMHLVETEALGEAVDRLQREQVSGTVPLPTLVLDGAYRINRRFSVAARAQYFVASYEDVDGDFGDYQIDVQYRWRRNFTVGLGYSMIALDVESDDIGDSGLVDLTAKGPVLFFQASF